MPDNWVPSDPASPQEIGKALLINGPGMDDPIARAYIQRLQGQQGLNIEDMVRGTSPAPPPVAPQHGPVGGLFGVPTQYLASLTGNG